MKLLVLGCGNIGSVAAEEIARSVRSIEVVVADTNKERAEAVAERISNDTISWMQLDATNHTNLVKVLKDFDLAMGFLPGKLGYCLAEACIDAETDLVDVSYMVENPFMLNEKAERAGITIVPDCGLAPGISNILVGHVAGEIDKVRTVSIMVGGLPEIPVPPLDYVITWSVDNLIDEYTRKARIVRNGEIVEVEALSGLEEVEFPDIGRLEAFYTDGLRTLPYTLKNVDNMWEKTLRYPGHAEKIRLLKSLGLFDEDQIELEGVGVVPRKLAVKLLAQKLMKPEIRDVVVMNIEVSGVKNDQEKRYIYHLLEHYDKERGITAMARTTANPASIMAQLVLGKRVRERGIVPPEKTGMDQWLFRVFLTELEKRGIKIAEEIIG